jgi:two-component system sensor histidine kinase DegS
MQEDLRRDIARQMHDGPAQSLANIALQAEIVQRLLAKDPQRAAEEVEQLRAAVQHALDTTKTFIFDVRPMVLDDLGLVPTLRRAAADRGRRAGVPVVFESVGADQRLGPDVESSFFRILDDALAGYLSLAPSAVHLRLDWSPHELRATVSSGRPEERAADARAVADARKADPTDLPPALAEMIEAQRAGEREAWTHARALPPERWREIQARAEAVGVSVTLLADDQTLEAVARWSD